MARVHCVDCGIDVAVDPLGQCPEGHLLPAAGARVSSAIGSDEPYPDEPVPWVGQVVLDEPVETVETVVAERTAQPSAAPGLAPAQRETVPGDLLRELGDLSSDAHAGTASPTPGAPARPDLPPSATATVTAPPASGHAPTTNGHTPAANDHTPEATAATSELSELSALEQAVQSLETGSTRDAAPTQQPEAPTQQPEAPAPQAGAPATDLDDDLGRLFDDLDGLGDEAPANSLAATPAAAPPPAPSASPAPAAPSAPPAPPAPASGESQWEALADVADLAAGEHTEVSPPSAAAPPAEAPPARPAIDTMNFTAKGGPTKGRRRRLLGR